MLARAAAPTKSSAVVAASASSKWNTSIASAPAAANSSSRWSSVVSRNGGTCGREMAHRMRIEGRDDRRAALGRAPSRSPRRPPPGGRDGTRRNCRARHRAAQRHRAPGRGGRAAHHAGALPASRSRSAGGRPRPGAPRARLRATRAPARHEHVAGGVRVHFGQLDAAWRAAGTARRSRRRRSPRCRPVPPAPAPLDASARLRRPGATSPRSRVSTMCRRPGQRPGKLSKVLRPMIIGRPMVSALKRLRSSGICQGSVAVACRSRRCRRARS